MNIHTQMVKLIESKVTAWVAMALVVALIVLSFLLGTPWWGFIAEFFCFIAVFSHLASLYLRRMSPAAGRKLDTCALVCIIIAVIGFIAEYIVFNVDFGL